MVLLAQGVHRLPESFMLVRRELALSGQGLERFSLPQGPITLDQVYHFAIQNKKTAIYPASFAERLFLKAFDIIATQPQCAEATWRLNSRGSG